MRSVIHTGFEFVRESDSPAEYVSRLCDWIVDVGERIARSVHVAPKSRSFNGPMVELEMTTWEFGCLVEEYQRAYHVWIQWNFADVELKVTVRNIEEAPYESLLKRIVTSHVTEHFDEELTVPHWTRSPDLERGYVFSDDYEPPC